MFVFTAAGLWRHNSKETVCRHRFARTRTPPGEVLWKYNQ